MATDTLFSSLTITLPFVHNNCYVSIYPRGIVETVIMHNLLIYFLLNEPVQMKLEKL